MNTPRDATAEVLLDEKRQRTIIAKLWKTDIRAQLIDTNGEFKNFRIHYDAKITGPKAPKNSIQGEAPISGDVTMRVRDDPEVWVAITGWVLNADTLSFHARVTVNKMGTHTVFDHNIDCARIKSG